MAGMLDHRRLPCVLEIAGANGFERKETDTGDGG